MEDYLDRINRIIEAVNHVVSGKGDVVKMAVAALIAGGHILIEDIPGVGKTTLALALSKVMQLDYRRMQFTPDVMPTDVVGYRLYSKTGEDMGLKSGSIMCNLFLADEINRTSPKTQSALLEVMEEGNVTVDGVTVSVPRPFHVIATQNPIGSTGTQALPESQLDRFMVRLSLGYPNVEDEIELMRSRHEKDPMDDLVPVMDKEGLIAMQKEADHIYVHDAVYDYVARLAEATRGHELITLGISPRGSLALVSMAKAIALMNGREFVIPEDVDFCFASTVLHRMILNSRARVGNMTLERIAKDIVSQTPKPKLIMR